MSQLNRSYGWSVIRWRREFWHVIDGIVENNNIDIAHNQTVQLSSFKICPPASNNIFYVLNKKKRAKIAACLIAAFVGALVLDLQYFYARSSKGTHQAPDLETAWLRVLVYWCEQVAISRSPTFCRYVRATEINLKILIQDILRIDFKIVKNNLSSIFLYIIESKVRLLFLAIYCENTS